MKTFKVKNFEKYQHYKDRNPPWIKLYTCLLDDYKFSCLQDASKLQLILIFLLASKNNNELPWDEKWIQGRIGTTSKVDLKVFEKQGLIEVVAGCEQDDSDELAKRYREQRREEKSRAEHTLFDELWDKYPNKDGKAKAKGYFTASVNVEKEKDVSDIKKALSNYLSCRKVKNGYVKNGSTWFNNWRDWIDWKEPSESKLSGRDAAIVERYGLVEGGKSFYHKPWDQWVFLRNGKVIRDEGALSI